MYRGFLVGLMAMAVCLAGCANSGEKSMAEEKRVVRPELELPKASIAADFLTTQVNGATIHPRSEYANCILTFQGARIMSGWFNVTWEGGPGVPTELDLVVRSADDGEIERKRSESPASLRFEDLPPVAGWADEDAAPRTMYTFAVMAPQSSPTVNLSLRTNLHFEYIGALDWDAYLPSGSCNVGAE